MKYPWAQVGQQVVCVNGEWGRTGASIGGKMVLPYRLPMQNEVLTIAAVTIGDGTEMGGHLDHPYLAFEEVEFTQSVPEVSLSVSWNADHFKPLFDKTIEADISTFRRIADEAPQRIGEAA